MLTNVDADSDLTYKIQIRNMIEYTLLTFTNAGYVVWS